MFEANMTFAQGIQLTVIAMAIVFSLLFGISLILGLFKHIPKDKPVASAKAKKSTPKPAPVPVSTVDMAELEADEDMMVAALVASMEAAGEDKDTNYKVVRVTRL